MCYSQDECLFTCHCTRGAIIGIPSPKLQTKKSLQIIKQKHLRSHNLYFIAWEPPLMCLAWKILITDGREVNEKGACLKLSFTSIIKHELWHLCKSLVSSVKGLSIYFYVVSSPSQISARTWEHCCHAYALCVANVGCVVTGSFLPWITMFSRYLTFGGALHLCFAVSERASEIPSCYIILWLFWESVVIRDLLLLLASWLCHWYE